MSRPPGQVRTQHVQVDGRAVEYLVAGAGPVVVLLHGDGETARDWQWVMPGLAAAGHHVLALSLPGHGGSASADSYAQEDLSAWLASVLEALDLDRATVVGNSIGALMALHLALDRPERVERLVLVDSAGLGRLVNPVVAAETLPRLGEAAIAMSLMAGGAPLRAAVRSVNLFGQPWRAPAGWWLDQLRWGSAPALLHASVECKRAILGAAGQHHVLSGRLGEVGVPTLVLWGLLDKVVPFTHGLAAARRLHDGRFQLLAGCGHMPHVECPKAFVAAVLRFLAERDGGDAVHMRPPRAAGPAAAARGAEGRAAPTSLNTPPFGTSAAPVGGLNPARAVVRYTAELTRGATAAAQLLRLLDGLLTPQRTAAVASLLDQLPAALSQQRTTPVHALLERLATLLSAERTEALSALADQIPRLVTALQLGGLPTPGELRQLAPDIHAMLELIDEVHQVVTGMPGAQRARKRDADPHPQVVVPHVPVRTTVPVDGSQDREDQR
ncbi:MAG: alpha/beta hydrolase [Actinomycetota bacterium]|nr:alpha/beta hydrolase [Actinomycetota bacterium]